MTFKMKNVGEKDFPGGKAVIWIGYTSGQKHIDGFTIPEIKKGEEKSTPKNSRAALAKGYALFFGKITANDGGNVKIVAYDQELPENASFYAIAIETRADVYSYYLLIISTISLVSLVVSSLLQLLFKK